jgi:transcriptional regulator with XRE-family HTH domain
MARTKTLNPRQRMRNMETNAFLESLNGGRLTFAQMLSACRRSRAESVAVFAARLGVSRQHLHQLETGNKGVSPERAVRFARCLGQSETYFLQLALQDLANESGVRRKVEVRVA